MNINKKIETKTAEIWIDDDEIVHLKIKEGAKIDLQQVQKHFNIYKKLGCQKNKTLHLFEGGAFFTFEKAAMQYVYKHVKHFFLASAIVNNSLAVRINIDLFNSFINTSFPFKTFSTNREAQKWLSTFKKKTKPKLKNSLKKTIKK